MILPPQQYIKCDRCRHTQQYDGYLPVHWHPVVSLTEAVKIMRLSAPKWEHICHRCAEDLGQWLKGTNTVDSPYD